MADTATALKSYNDIPVLDWDMQNPEASSYNLFKDLRAQTPLVKVPMGMGSLVLALRARMVDQIVSPENTRQLETEMKMMQGIFDGPIFDFVAQVMLFANGDVHQRRAIVSGLFADRGDRVSSQQERAALGDHRGGVGAHAGRRLGRQRYVDDCASPGAGVRTVVPQHLGERWPPHLHGTVALPAWHGPSAASGRLFCAPRYRHAPTGAAGGAPPVHGPGHAGRSPQRSSW